MTIRDPKMALALALLATIPERQGEMRVIYECGWCNKLFGRRFIPYGLGQGALYNPCTCELTGRPPVHKIAEATP